MSSTAPSPNPRTRSRTRSRDHRAGFTLLEILVSAVILGLIATLVLGIATQVGGIWRTVDGQKFRRTDARAILSSISTDLRGALLPTDPTSQNSVQFLVNPPGVSASSFRDCFFWQAALPRQGSASDIVTVGYFVRWDKISAPAHPVASLCRVYVPSSSSSSSTASYGTTFTVSDAFLSDIAPATRASNYKGLMAENVVGLWLALWDASGAPIASGGRPTYDSRKTEALPSVVEVELAILTPSVAAQLTAPEAERLSSLTASSTTADAFLATCTGASSPLAKIGRGLHVFRTRVYLGVGQ